MDITFTAKDFVMTEAIKEYAEKKAQRIEKHSENIMYLHLTFSKTREDFEVAAKFQIPRIQASYAVEKTNDMYKTIDRLVDKIIAIINKEKDR
jgi:ribosomal subunit interface protein